MKITFEGTLREILDDMMQMIEALEMLADLNGLKALPVDVTKPQGLTSAMALGLAPHVDKPVAKPVEKKPRTEKQLANDERMRVAALARIAARKAAKAAPVEKPPIVEEPADPFVQEPDTVDPAEIVNMRLRTIEELQEAYGNGHHKEVLELLSRFGDGAKSFRELKPEDFVPIREAIDLGALEGPVK